jgi:hypothetical protein
MIGRPGSASETGRRSGPGRPLLLVIAALAISAIVASAQEMPDPSLMHGRPLPASDLRDGTVTVRVMRESIGNNVPGQQVRVSVGSTVRTATTDQEGRAEFTGLPAGEARAEATVDGEKLESQPFAVPTSGGVRVALIAGIGKAAERKKQEEAAALAAPATKGVVVLGDDSRVLMEFQDDTLWTYYVLEIVNNARTRVDIGGPLRIDLPPEAAGAHLEEQGSSEGVKAEVDGTHVAIPGPFAPGTTRVILQFSLRYPSATYTLSQTFPVALQRVIVGVEKVGGLSLVSPQFTSVTEVPGDAGNVFVVGSGATLAAGTPLTFTLSNLPVHSRTARYVALSVALLIAAIGAWLARKPGSSAAASRKALVTRRDALLGELAQLEVKRRDGTITEKAERRRQRILGELEHIYAELDATAGPRGGGEGIAA